MQRLDEVLSHGRLSPWDAARIVSDVGRSLGGMHAAGESHLAVSPRAVTLDRNGEAHLMAAAAAGVERDPAYSSPELLRGESGDWRSDAWSLGVLLYRLLSDGEPFWGVTDVELERAILERDPEPLPFPDSLPEPALRFLDRALAKVPDRRFDAPAELSRDLEKLRSALAPRSAAAARAAAWAQAAPVETGADVSAGTVGAVSAEPGALERLREAREKAAERPPASWRSLLLVPSLLLLLLVALLLYCNGIPA